MSPLIVWPLLSDLEILFAAIPGATLTARGTAGAHGALRVKFGQRAALFRGEATFAHDRKEKRITVQARATDARGKSRASAAWVISASGSDETLVSIEGSVSVRASPY